jgi:hypothetical protein
MQDIPELSLNRGEVGIVRSTWFAPSVAYEVEFRNIDRDYQTRALLQEEQVQVEEGAAMPFEFEVKPTSLMVTPIVE